MMPARARDGWRRFWYAPAAPIDLAAARVVIALHALWILLSRDLAATSALPSVFWAGVPAAQRWRLLLFPGDGAVDRALQVVAAAALVAAAIGVWPRVACLCAALLLYHLAPLETIYWTPNPFERGFSVAVLSLVVLAAGRSGDALAVWPRPAPRPPAGDYRWPLVLVQLFLCQTYFFAGWAKVYFAGFGWASGDNLRRWLLAFTQQDQVWTFTALGYWVTSSPLLCGVIGAAALALDLGFITILIWPWLRPWLIGAALSFHAGIALVMGIVFLNIPQLLIFVDWDALGRRRRPRAFDPAGGPC